MCRLFFCFLERDLGRLIVSEGKSPKKRKKFHKYLQKGLLLYALVLYYLRIIDKMQELCNS